MDAWSPCSRSCSTRESPPPRCSWHRASRTNPRRCSNCCCKKRAIYNKQRHAPQNACSRMVGARSPRLGRARCVGATSSRRCAVARCCSTRECVAGTATTRRWRRTTTHSRAPQRCARACILAACSPTSARATSLTATIAIRTACASTSTTCGSDWRRRRTTQRRAKPLLRVRSAHSRASCATQAERRCAAPRLRS